ncbi:MAG: hypothetical protein AUJ92_20560 [Armatimonadetes bacterium CG2_30_59_28]|nr:MAG: hypothetical protein AUJ92_20560 [Armatimonadetes bacterium CG2_30_59_28]PIU63739.1 MAG: hypothetical protein COS85_15180 [Armatimonadetes bacterium CG07_land_8_20_14_0_80_59_28]PIX41641.1 MAG: hypothetical protein COZ56_11450 [Armatimonadetes bacterium CG_4_8_14_3_um_filter_58_9]
MRAACLDLSSRKRFLSLVTNEKVQKAETATPPSLGKGQCLLKGIGELPTSRVAQYLTPHIRS